MRQKIALVLTLAHDPDLLILDEPTIGLDPLAQRALLTLLDQLGQEGKTIFFSSHVLSEAEQICDRVAILRSGRLVALSPVEKLREQKHKEVTISYDGTPPSLNGLPDAEVIWQHEGRMTFRARGDTNGLLAFLSNCSLTDVSISEPSLEEVFLDYYRGEDTVEDARP
jgi:ABC-2 type transport system ATP-binding protein